MEGGRKEGRKKEENQGKEVKKLRRQRLFFFVGKEYDRIYI